jgi:hypothetical protein
MDAGSFATREDFINHSKEDRENFGSLHAKLDKIVSDHPTNGELGIMLSNIAKEVGEIKIQTTKTNGRVTILEAGSNERRGQGNGRKDMWGWIVGGVTFLIMVINFFVQYSQGLSK